jgi:hypothetical protein
MACRVCHNTVVPRYDPNQQGLNEAGKRMRPKNPSAQECAKEDAT